MKESQLSVLLAHIWLVASLFKSGIDGIAMMIGGMLFLAISVLFRFREGDK